MHHSCRLLLRLAQHALFITACWGSLAGDNWAVIVSSSRYWYNYRHESNALSVYNNVKRLGIPDRNIILMVADPAACNPRNIKPGAVFNDLSGQRGNLYTADTELDYQGRDVNVDNLLRVLTGRHSEHAALSKRLRSGPNSSVLLYLTGHGGDEFLKFHDHEELLAADLGNAVQQMHVACRYKQLLILLDTCQASTMFNRIQAPNVLGIATSKLGESSYAHFVGPELGVHLADQFTFHMDAFLRRLRPSSHATLQQLVDYVRGQRISSTIVPWASGRGGRRLSQVRVAEFFAGGVAAAAGDGSGGRVAGAVWNGNTGSVAGWYWMQARVASGPLEGDAAGTCQSMGAGRPEEQQQQQFGDSHTPFSGSSSSMVHMCSGEHVGPPGDLDCSLGSCKLVAAQLYATLLDAPFS